MSSSGDPFDVHDVRLAYDTVAEDYAARLPDTRAEAPLDLCPGMVAMARQVDARLAVVGLHEESRPRTRLATS